MATSNPKTEKSKKKKSKPAAVKWENVAGSGNPVKVDKLPLMAGPTEDIAAAYNRFNLHLGTITDPKERLICCEKVFGSLVDSMQTGPTKNLRAGIVLALMKKSNVYMSRLEQLGVPTKKRNITIYQSELLKDCSLGTSNSQVSRMRRAGDLFIRLVEAKLPVPDTAERLVRMLYFKTADLEQWRKLVGQSQNKAPDLKLINECIRKARKDSGSKSNTPEPADPVISPVLIVKRCSSAMIQLKKEPPNVAVALDHLQRLLDEVNGNSPSDGAAASAHPAPIPRALENGKQSALAAADEEETGLRYLVARHGTEVRITRHSNVDLTPNDVAWVVSFADNSPYDWRSRNSEERPDDTCQEGEWRCSNQTEAGAQECYAATVARVKKLSWSGPEAKP